MSAANILRSRMVRCGALCAMLSLVGLLSTRHSVRTGRVSAANLTADPRVRQALAKLATAAPALTDEQARITEIPAPPFHEAARGKYLAKQLAAAGLNVQTDDVGNVIGERAGSSKNDIVMVVAHLDTVFPADTDVRVKRTGGRLYAALQAYPTTGTGLAAMLRSGAEVLHDLESSDTRCNHSFRRRRWRRG